MVEVTSFILAGGQSKRFGSNKALALLNDRPLIETVAGTLLTLFPKVYVVTKKLEEYAFLKNQGVGVIQDLKNEHHPLSGLYTALKFSPTAKNFICACDMPFIQVGLIQALYEASAGYDACLASWQDKAQALCGFYSKNCLSAVEAVLQKEESPTAALFDLVRARFLNSDEIALVDPRGLSFMDIDCPQDLKNLKRLFYAY